VANLTIASTPRKFDKQTQTWVDEQTTFLRASIWRDAAENVAESLTRGMRVVAYGRLKSRSYEKDGQSRTVMELDLEAIGPDLSRATARVTKAQRTGIGGGQAAPVDDPWAQGPQASEAPF
jgi:single-strand DNA-binding protein